MKEDIKELKRTAELILQAVTVTKPQGKGPLAEWLKAEIKEMKGVLKNMEGGMKSMFKSVAELNYGRRKGTRIGKYERRNEGFEEDNGRDTKSCNEATTRGNQGPQFTLN